MPFAYLLDTHIPIDASSNEGVAALPTRVRQILEDPEVELLLSVVSDVEIAIKHAAGKLDFPRDEFARVCSEMGIVAYPLRQRHTRRLFELPEYHRDPFDRMIISAALSDELPIISRDRQFRRYSGLKVIWN